MRNIEHYLMSVDYEVSGDKYYLFKKSTFDSVIVKKDNKNYIIEYKMLGIFLTFIAYFACTIPFILLDGLYFEISAAIFIMLTLLSLLRVIVYEVRVCYIRILLLNIISFDH
ncbi:hypothetical protein L1D26_08740 [Vibrio mediterranei]|uniref:Uncharacterized protein n=1 Tax=Vibrio mediterranei TaxID=689 RepID=A0ABX5DEP9_9VIBR|nr:hypothetical protein [Vibrio mediterranei]MCG9663144.1 hypothetical protein [Vibrio mediterranei]PCD89465.1 hypothetical protein COR52_05965 [Vibrio mediterranei]PRQ68174.1 hypothetical protein COR51_06860 [Vibrio mediterranei]